MDKKKIISKKLGQMAILFEVIGDLAKTGDSVSYEISCATTLLKGLNTDIAALVDES